MTTDERHEKPPESAATELPAGPDETREERMDLLALCTETKRLGRARKERGKVHLQVDGPDLYIASVSAYNVVLDVPARRIQHGCRDFLTEGRAGRLCKHVAALLLAIEPAIAVEVLRGVTDPTGDWHVEVIATRGFSR